MSRITITLLAAAGALALGAPPALARTALCTLHHGTSAKAAANGVSAKRGTQRWSRASAWSGRAPAKGDLVTIPKGSTVVLDRSTPALDRVVIKGTLKWDDGARTLRARGVHVEGGRLQIGTAAKPHLKRARIQLRGSAVNGGRDGLGDAVLAVTDGTLSLHGAPRTAWAHLATTARRGATTITTAEPTDWAKGDSLVIAPTDWGTWKGEEVTLAGTGSGRSLSLARKLSAPHAGITSRQGPVTLDQRAEVALLDRSIVISGDRSGGHTMFMGRSTIDVDNARFTGLGRLGELRRYPVHFHFMGDRCRAGRCRITDSIVDHAKQRGFVIHRTDGVVLDRDVVAGTTGHAFMTESANEIDNVVTHSLAMSVGKIPVGKSIEPNVEQIQAKNRSSGFWISNAHNTFTDDVAAGIEHGFGFWIVHGVNDTERDADVNGIPNDGDHPRDPQLDEELLHIDRNTAHNANRTRGDDEENNLGYGPVQTGSGFNVDGAGSANAVYDRITSYANENSGLWGPGGYAVTWTNAAVADNRSGVINPQGTTGDITLVDSAVIFGSPGSLGADLRARQRRYDEAFAIRAFDDEPIDPIGSSIARRNVFLSGFRDEELPKG